jgi:oxazoline/thiazoline synthase
MPNRDKSSEQELILTTASHFTASARGNQLLLCSESISHVLDGAIYVAIAEALSQSLSWEDLRTRLTSQFALPEIQTAVTVLGRLGYVRPKKSRPHLVGFAAWLDSMGTEPGLGSVSLQVLDALVTPMLEELLGSAGLSLSADAPFRVVLAGDYLDSRLSAISREADKPWLLAKLSGHTVWIGPLFVPGASPCWNCLAWWARMHRWQEWGFSGGENNCLQRPSVAHWPATLAVGAGMLANAAAVLGATGDHPELRQTVLTIDTRTLTQTRHKVRPVPGCDGCGALPKPAPTDVREFVSFATGIVEELEISAEPAAGLFHARSRFVHALPAVPAHTIMRPSHSFGKGASADAAAIACTAEAIERYSAAWRGTEAITLARSCDIEGIPVNDLGQFSDTQFESRARATFGEESMFWIPHRLQPDTTIGWVECRPLGANAPRYAPAAAVYYAYPFETVSRYFVPDSNGCAAGRSHEDAIAGALSELVERDALAIWWYNRLGRPAVRLREDDLDDLSVNALGGLRSEERTVWVLDLTTDLGIPAYVALASKRDGSDVAFGAASHICPHRAVQKALSEVSQVLYWKDKVAPDPHMSDWFHLADSSAAEFSWLLAHGEVDLPTPRRLPPADAIAELVSSLARAGVSSSWVDLTRPETGVPVVRAFAPGLRHPWRRFAPGRLYDVPVKLGWLEKPTSETDLNPIGCML